MAQREFRIQIYQYGKNRVDGLHAAVEQSGTVADDQQRNLRYDFSGRDDVQHAEIVLPSRFEGDAHLDWARNRGDLWKVMEPQDFKERGKGMNFARKYYVVLPSELDDTEHRGLARVFAQALADRNRTAVDFAIHGPHEGHDNPYVAHLLTPVREITPEGPGAVIAPTRGEHRELRLIWESYREEALLTAHIKEVLREMPDTRKTWEEYKRQNRIEVRSREEPAKVTGLDDDHAF